MISSSWPLTRVKSSFSWQCSKFTAENASICSITRKNYKFWRTKTIKLSFLVSKKSRLIRRVRSSRSLNMGIVLGRRMPLQLTILPLAPTPSASLTLNKMVEFLANCYWWIWQALREQLIARVTTDSVDWRVQRLIKVC